jgi:AcrR family transcriptional regulator
MKFQFLAKPHVEYDESLNSVRILRAAKRVFIRDGGAVFSARGVAKEAKVSLGAVQHFFPSKHDLLSAMLEYVVNQYEGAYQKVFQKLPVNGRARLLGVIDLLNEDIWDQETRLFFVGFWALACHNADAAELKFEMYAYHINRLAGFIGAADPAISETRARELAIQLAAMFEGLMLFAGSRGRHLSSREQMSRMVKESVLALLSAAQSRTGGRRLKSVPGGRD